MSNLYYTKFYTVTNPINTKWRKGAKIERISTWHKESPDSTYDEMTALFLDATRSPLTDGCEFAARRDELTLGRD